MIPILFARQDSAYKNYPDFDVYDIDRDARKYAGSNAVIAHPPCRAWGCLSHMAKPRHDEKELALFSVDLVRKLGGIVEHPYSSKLWNTCSMNMQDLQKDEYGGFLVTIDQFDFGHVARKNTRLYICGIDPEQLPALPPQRTDTPTRSIAGNVKGTKRCTQYQREYTPNALIFYMKDVYNLIEWNKKD